MRTREVRFWALYGVLVWLLATVAVRMLGPWLLPGTAAATAVLFVVTVPALWVVLAPAYRTPRAERLPAAAVAALPGLLLDVVAVLGFAWLFPALPAGRAALYGAWLLWAYGLVLAWGLLLGRSAGNEGAAVHGTRA